MSPVIVVFGAGTGLGVSLARRFGREGFRVALVGRRIERLEALASELAEDGIEAGSFTGDLSIPSNVPDIVDAIRARFGRIDVVEYGPVDGNPNFSAAAELDGPTLQNYLNMFTFTPLEIVRTVLPELRERGGGAILVTHGSTVLNPTPFMSGLAPAMSATRSYLHSLNGELEGTGVYVGTLVVGAVIERSEGAIRVAESSDEFLDSFPKVDPDVLADHYWDMYTTRDRVERTYPE